MLRPILELGGRRYVVIDEPMLIVDLQILSGVDVTDAAPPEAASAHFREEDDHVTISSWETVNREGIKASPEVKKRRFPYADLQFRFEFLRAS